MTFKRQPISLIYLSRRKKPLGECGEQIVPLLQHMQSNGAGCSFAWLTREIDMAVQYEINLRKYYDIVI